jgi:uncharacterized protein YbaP (TraB family)
MLKSVMHRIGAALGVTLLLGAAPAEARAPQPAHPALWKISDPDTTIYLFGTIHLLPQALKWRTPEFDQAVESSQELVVETIVDQQNPAAVQSAMFSLGIKPGLPPIADRIPKAKVPKMRAYLAKAGIPEKALNRMETWLAWLTLVSTEFKDMGLKGSNGPEEVLRQQFLGEQKPIGQLETPTEQFGFFARLPEAAQRKLFVDQIDQGPHEDTKAAYDQMLSPWTRGDVKSIAVTFNKDLMTSPELKASLLEQRNANWAKWIEQRLGQPGTILVAVGAGHLAGKDSVIARLQTEGYKVTRLQ